MIKHSSVYISDKYKHIIIAAKYENYAGIIYEQEQCCSLGLPVNLTELGNEIINNLNLYSIMDKDLRNNKQTDWPAFKYGKATSVNAFEQDYINISINCANEKNLNLILEGHPFKKSQLTINSVISFYIDKEELGQRIMDVYVACLTGKIF